MENEVLESEDESVVSAPYIYIYTRIKTINEK